MQPLPSVSPLEPQKRSPIWLMLWPLAILLRITNLYGVFVNGQVFLYSTDPFYHLRRIVLTLSNFPHVPDKDLYLNFPYGLETHWPYGFDIIMSTIISIVTLGHPDSWWAEAIGALLPPLIGGLLPLVIYLIAMEFTDQLTALFAGLFSAILPSAIDFSQIGYLDHHFLAALCQALFWLTYIRATKRKNNLSAILCGVVASIAFISCTEFPITAAIHGIFLVVCWFTVDNERRNELLLINLKVFATTTILLLPCVFTKYFEPSGVSPLVASAWFGCLGLTIFLAIVSTWKKQLSKTTFVTILILAAIFIFKFDFTLIPKFLSETEIHQGSNALGTSIRENRAIIFDSFSFIMYWHTGFLLLSPIMVFLLVKRRSEVNLLILVTLLIIEPIGLLHMRLELLLAVPFALASALLAKEGLLLAKQYFPKNHQGEILAGVIILLLLVPSVSRIDYSNPSIVVSHRPFMPLYNSFNWLKQHSPDVNPNQPEYGVIANEWDIGHWLVRFSARPTVATPLTFGTGVSDSAKIFVQPPSEAIKTLENRKLRYILLTPDDFLYLLELAGAEPPKPNQDFDTLYGRLLASYAFPGLTVSNYALNRFRIVYQTAETTEGEPPLPNCMIFELVKGAHLTGQIKPNAMITVNTKLTTSTNRTIPYSTSIKADEQGNFDIIVPYSTGIDSSTTILASSYLVKTEEAITSVEVTTAQVRNGEIIKVKFQH